jgi:GT2 family glycosyltransferase
VPGFPRFDSDEVEMLSDRDIKKRWKKFHGSIRLVQGHLLQRIIGRMLGEDTIRYKTARFFGRPVLRLARHLRGKPQVASVVRLKPAVKPAVKPVFFPQNYRPPTGAKANNKALVMPDGVEFAVVSEVTSSANETIKALNETIATTTASWLFIVDESAPELDRVAAALALLAAADEADDVVFADESGQDPCSPLLKSSAVGPHTLLSYNCVGRPTLLRVATLRSLGGFRAEAGWAFEHDAYLRLVEQGARFHHVAVVLVAGRPAISFEAPHISTDTQAVVRNALARRGWEATVTPGAFASSTDWRPVAPSPAPSIDIIIPTRDRIDLVRQCINALEQKTTYTNYDIIILDNDSKEPETLEYFASTRYRVVPCPGPFNYACIVNRGVKHSSADYVVTLNNDTIVVTPNWLEQMVGLASLPDVSIVGACLLDQDGRHEHDSIVISPYPQHLRIDSNYPHVDQFSTSIRDVAAVTGAVQMVRRELWESLGGMDELLKVTMNDVDICLRSQDDGKNVVYTPDVQLYHHVSSSRGSLDPLIDRNRFIRRWDIFETFRDPYFPESLLLLGETVYYRHR